MNYEQLAKKLIRGKTSGHCAYCGIELDRPPGFGERNGTTNYSTTWTVDHLTPISKGGDESLDNLVPACKGCNSSKKNRTLKEYRQWLPGGSTKRLLRVRDSIKATAQYFPHDRIERILALLDELIDEMDELEPVFYMDTLNDV